MQIVLDFDVKAEWLVSVIGIKIYKHKSMRTRNCQKFYTVAINVFERRRFNYK